MKQFKSDIHLYFKKLDDSMELREKSLIKFFIFFGILLNISVLLNIPYIRPIIAFISLSFFPGILLINYFNIRNLEFLEFVVISFVLSLSFLLIFGLLFNNFLLFLTFPNPLSWYFILLLVDVNILLIIITLKRKGSIISLPSIFLTSEDKFFIAPAILAPSLSIVGMHYINNFNTNTIIIFLLFYIALYIIYVSIFHGIFSTTIYPIILFFIGFSLLLLLALRCPYIIGDDTHIEYYLFYNTISNLHWSVFDISVLDACLSISLVPTFFASFLNFPKELLFKILYAVFYSVSPIIIYFISKNYLKEQYAFYAALFFIFQPSFIITATNSRTSMAVIFYLLFIFILFHQKIELEHKRILFVILITSAILSHYSTSMIFFLILMVVYLLIHLKPSLFVKKEKFLSFSIIFTFLFFMYIWYDVITSAPMTRIFNFIGNFLSTFNYYFYTETRSIDVQILSGIGIMDRELPAIIQFIFTWSTIILTSFGLLVIIFITYYNKKGGTKLEITHKNDFFSNNFDNLFILMSIISLFILVLTVIMPYLSVGYDIFRVYPIALATLSPFFVVGAIMTIILFRKMTFKIFHTKNNNTKKYIAILLLFILIPYFFCISGVMYNAFGVPRDIILNSEGRQYQTRYTHDSDVYAPKWLKNNIKNDISLITDSIGHGKLLSQGNFPERMIYMIEFIKNDTLFIQNSYIYLSYTNNVYKMIYFQRTEKNIISYHHLIKNKNIIYSNGDSKILGRDN